MGRYAEMYKDGYNDGFKAGVAYVFSHIGQEKLNEQELTRFISWIELKHPLKEESEWWNLIRENYIRMTQKSYEECKAQYASSREKYKDDPGWVRYFNENEAKLDEEWRKIKETGVY